MQVTFICGYLCSGKTTLANTISNGNHIEVSTIVKELKQSTKRTELQNSADLDIMICTILSKKLAQFKDSGIENVFVTGARQVSILEHIEKQFTCSYIWLEVSESERYRRFQLNEESKEDETSLDAFKIAQERDYILGLGRVKQFIFSRDYAKVK